MSSSVPKFFQPIHIGTADLQHRRKSTPGTVAISEATIIAARAGDYAHAPGIWSDEQIAASFIFLQLWALGRAARSDVLQREGGYPLRHPTPPLTVTEIKEYVQLYTTAAENAILKAGFDGTDTNTRADEYGGSVQNRARFVLEVTNAVVKAVGANKVGIHLSPWSTIQAGLSNPLARMKMPDPVPTFTEVVTRIREDHPDFAYIHVVESTVPKFDETARAKEVYIANSDFGRDTAIQEVEKEGGLISFGRSFISNPDLPRHLKENIKLTPHDEKTYFTPGAEGYIDHPFATEEAAMSWKGRY
ncbi:hypothetical protein B0F90DRAFT_1810775 [Multifurca ochricompacta]|uniref:NADH:flavin oxidoreductase/NADH oxidase N-terminal domain-containing protein n=1 Tax=Multifurca ochricompacta TaxID=376703 RepID=A0AAD4M2S2_9AGAM|nr:hypothetical protein B0F90DRAFT_1810775 [Multifurca ochricompacta]